MDTLNPRQTLRAGTFHLLELADGVWAVVEIRAVTTDRDRAAELADALEDDPPDPAPR